MIDFIISWLGSGNDRMMKGDFLVFSLNNLKDRVLFVKIEKNVGVNDFWRKSYLYNNFMNNRYYYFFFIL